VGESEIRAENDPVEPVILIGVVDEEKKGEIMKQERKDAEDEDG
jgi:hypothetical protein